MALHMSRVKNEPAAPTSVPAMIMDMLCMAKPVTAAARPVQELSTEITTGMSAPPMGSTCRTPSKAPHSQKIIQATTVIWIGGHRCTLPAAARMPKTNSTLIVSGSGQRKGFSLINPCNFPKATRLPVKLTAPKTIPKSMGKE
jgi:hypothetical protein